VKTVNWTVSAEHRF